MLSSLRFIHQDFNRIGEMIESTTNEEKRRLAIGALGVAATGLATLGISTTVVGFDVIDDSLVKIYEAESIIESSSAIAAGGLGGGALVALGVASTIVSAESARIVLRQHK